MAKSVKSVKSAAATNGKKVAKVTKSKAERNVEATEKAGVKTKAVMGGQQVAPVSTQGQVQQPAKGRKAAKAAKAAKGKGKAKGNGVSVQQGQRGRKSDFPLEFTVKACGNPADYTRDGSFTAKVMAMAAKPITLGALIDAATAKRKEFFRNSTAAESADTARRALTVRIRDLVRSEYLVKAK